MPLSDKMRRMIALGKAMARARAEAVVLLERIARRSAAPAAGSRMLSPSEIERLRQKTKRDNASSRARYAKMERPEELTAPEQRGGPEESQATKDARRERLQQGTRRTIEYVRAELPKMLSPEDIEELRKDGDTPLVRAALEWQAKQKAGK